MTLLRCLIEKGANVEARNRHGDTPLQTSVSRFDLAVTKALLEHGASLDSLNEDRTFRMNFSSLELKCYALTFNVIEMVKLLKSKGYEMDFLDRLRVVKCWIKARGNDIDHLIAEDTGDCKRDRLIFLEIVRKISFYSEFGFYIKPETMDYLHERCKNLRPRVPQEDCNYQPHEREIDSWRKDVEKIKEIKITEDISLYKLCQMSYKKGYSIIKNIKNWHMPPMDHVSTCDGLFLKTIVKRHIANISIRPCLDLELLAADFFMSDYCQLDLPYIVCHNVSKYMSDEELLFLFEKTNVNVLE